MNLYSCKTYFKPKSYPVTFGHGYSSGEMFLASASQTLGQRFRRGRASVLNSLGYKNSYNDELLCYPSMRLSNEHPSKTNPVGVEIKCIPNPNTGSFMIYSQSLAISTFTIAISDVLGSNIDYSIEKTGINSVSVTLNKTVPGIYLIRVFELVSGELQAAEPLIIINE